MRSVSVSVGVKTLEEAERIFAAGLSAEGRRQNHHADRRDLLVAAALLRHCWSDRFGTNWMVSAEIAG